MQINGHNQIMKSLFAANRMCNVGARYLTYTCQIIAVGPPNSLYSQPLFQFPSFSKLPSPRKKKPPLLRIHISRFDPQTLAPDPNLSFAPLFVENFALFRSLYLSLSLSVSLFLSLSELKAKPIYLSSIETLKLDRFTVREDRFRASAEVSHRHCECHSF